MTAPTKSTPYPKPLRKSDAVPYDMFQSLQQTRLKAAEANRKRLLASNAPAVTQIPEE